MQKQSWASGIYKNIKTGFQWSALSFLKNMYQLSVSIGYCVLSYIEWKSILISFTKTIANNVQKRKTNINKYILQKRKKYFKKKLDIKDYFLFLMSVVFRKILRLQYKPSTTYMDNYRLAGLNLLFKIF